MTDHDTITPEADADIRSRLRAFAEEVKERTDTEVALQRLPRRSRPPTIRLVAIAACLTLAVAIAAVVLHDRQSVDTVPPSQSPTTECPTPTQPRAITPGGQMKMTFAAPVASAATALMLLGACSDDGPATLAQGVDVELVGTDGLGAQTLNITAEEENGEVTGEFRISDVVVRVECADTDTDGVVILGGEITTGEGDDPSLVGELHALIIRKGDPDSVHLKANDAAVGSCTELLGSIPNDLLTDDSQFVDVEAGNDIKTG